jgi:CubicO group peptidase (beta-lactamase class C family)
VGDDAAVAAIGATGVLSTRGDTDRLYEWASVTKLVTALASLVAVEEGTLDLDEQAGPPGATIRHLLAHAAGLPFEGDTPIAAPATRRTYSNSGFRMVATVLERSSNMRWPEYVRAAVLDPLGMRTTDLGDDPAAGARGPLDDLTLLGRELLHPRLIAKQTRDAAITVQFPGLAGLVPGIGRFDPCDWGLGFELRDGKDPHWTGTTNSARTFGHFGRSGTFLWIDPDLTLAVAYLSDREFGPWALEEWPALSDELLASRFV